MKNLVFLLFTAYFTMCQIAPAFPKSKKTEVPAQVETLDNSITASVYSFKKTRHYVAVEIGFTNPTDGYLEFTPTEIYLDDQGKYSKSPLTVAELQGIESRNPGIGIVPGALAVGLGLAAIGTGIYGKNGAARGLGVAALGAGGAYALTKGIEGHGKSNRLIKFENNSLGGIKRLPPGMTLGGYLFFPAAKKPTSVTIVAKSKGGKYEKKTFYLQNVKKG